MVNKKFVNPCHKLILFETSDKEKIEKTLGYGQSLNEKIAEIISQYAEGLEIEKNLIALQTNRSAIACFSNNNNEDKDLKTLHKQQTLDIYSDNKEISNHINRLEDLPKLRNIRRKGNILVKVSQTRINKLVGGNN